MARDRSYDSLFQLQDAGFQGLGGQESPIWDLISHPVSVGEFLRSNQNILDKGKAGILQMALKSLTSPFNKTDKTDEYEFGEDEFSPEDFKSSNLDVFEDTEGGMLNFIPTQIDTYAKPSEEILDDSFDIPTDLEVPLNMGESLNQFGTNNTKRFTDEDIQHMMNYLQNNQEKTNFRY